MKRQRLGLALTALLVLSGCGGIEKMTESTVTVDDKGTVEELLLEDFSDEDGQTDELTTQIQTLVDTYNKENNADTVAIKKLQIKDGKAKVELEYQSAKDYRGFNQVDFFAGSVKEAQKEGYSFASDFIDAKGKDASSAGIPDGCEQQQVIIIREPLQVLVPGKILYVSKNMKIVNESQAKLSADDEQDAESQATTQAYGYVIYQPEQ